MSFSLITPNSVVFSFFFSDALRIQEWDRCYHASGGKLQQLACGKAVLLPGSSVSSQQLHEL